VESRRIFRKLRAYVTYRFAATIQIVIVLTLLIYISNCSVNSTFVILLALFNDITMLPIAYDRQQASSIPENPDVFKLLTIAFSLGCMETCFSMIFAYGANPSGIFQYDYVITDCDNHTQAAIWLQMFIAAELLIFVTRAPSFIVRSLPPSLPLFTSVITGCFIASLMAGLSQTFGGLAFVDIVLIWSYNLIGLIILDTLKVALFKFFEENTEVLPDIVETGSVSDKPNKGHGRKSDVEAGNDIPEVAGGKEEEDFSRASMSTNRLTDWAIAHGAQQNRGESGDRSSMSKKIRRSSAAMVSMEANKSILRESFNSRYSLSHNVGVANSTDLRPSFVSGSIRPNIPANKSRF
jgi:hypothetical protein